VTVVLVTVVWWKLPTMVPLVNGEIRFSGESMESVLVIFADEGVPE
jgi:hypothetical protein